METGLAIKECLCIPLMSVLLLLYGHSCGMCVYIRGENRSILKAVETELLSDLFVHLRWKERNCDLRCY